MTTSRRTRSRRSVTAILLLGAAALALGACSDDGEVAAGDPAPVGPVEGPQPDPEELASSIEITATDHHFETSVTRVAAGAVTFELGNEGAEPHQVHVAELPAGTTAEEVAEAFEAEGEAELFGDYEWVGGVAGVEPGSSASSTSVLEPGRYVLLCFIPSPGPHGEAHLSQGMVATIEAVETDEPAELPDAEEEIELRDFAVDIPKGFGGGPVLVRNEGEENHELVLMRFHEGSGAADLMAWSEAGRPEQRPFDFAGGTGTIAPGATAWADLDLRPGDYIALCVVQGAAHVPHVELGMATLFTVA